MNPESTPSYEKQPRDAAYWAQYAAKLKVARASTGALNLNVEGRRAMSPLQGFGQMWQKTFSIRMNGAQVKPAEVIKTWKERFPTFWPKWDNFYQPLNGIAPGEVALINMLIPGDIPHGLPLSTGVLVLYADEESFTFMNPEGHMFATGSPLAPTKRMAALWPRSSYLCVPTTRPMNWAFDWGRPAQRISSDSTRSPRWQRTSEW